MQKTRWTADALRARLHAERTLNACSTTQRPLAVKRLELLAIIEQVDSNAISPEFATERLNMLTDTLRTISAR